MTIKEKLDLAPCSKVHVKVNFISDVNFKDEWEEDFSPRMDWETFINHIYNEAEATHQVNFEASEYGIYPSNYKNMEDYRKDVLFIWHNIATYKINIEVEGFRYYLHGYSWDKMESIGEN